MSMVSVCLPSDALSQHLPSYLGFSYPGLGVSLHGCSSKAQPLLLTLDEGYLLSATPPDLQHGIASLGSLAPAQPPFLGCGVGPPSRHPWPGAWGSSSPLLPLSLGLGSWGVGSSTWPLPLTSDLGSSSQLFLHHCSLALLAAAPDLGRGVTSIGRRPSGMGSSQLLPLTSDVG